MRRSWIIAMLIGVGVGVAGGVVAALLTGIPPITLALLGGFYGVSFALLVGARATSPGAGLLWGLGYALLMWLAGPVGLFPLLGGTPALAMLTTARAHFPELVAYLLCFGMPLGLWRWESGACGNHRLAARVSIWRERWC